MKPFEVVHYDEAACGDEVDGEFATWKQAVAFAKKLAKQNEGVAYYVNKADVCTEYSQTFIYEDGEMYESEIG